MVDPIKPKSTTGVFLSPEERISLDTIPATEKMPEILGCSTGDGWIVESEGAEVPQGKVNARKLSAARHGTLWCVEPKFEGKGVRTLRIGLEQGHIEAAELQKFSRGHERGVSESFRPKWLNLRYHPSIVPRYRRLRPSELLVPSAFPPGALTLYRGELELFNDWPWCTAGKLFVGRGSDFENPTAFGSGVLVGPNLMMTASHAAPWGVDQWWMRFVPAYRDGAGRFGASYVRRFYGVRFADDDSDYVICELYQPIGNICGWMGSWSSSDDDFYEDRGWDSIGYPTDFFDGQRPAVEWNITPEDADVSGSEVAISFSSPFSSGGWSGGPLLGWVDNQPRVVGIMRGIHHTDYWITSDDDTLFTGGSHMVDLIKHSLTNWPV